MMKKSKVKGSSAEKKYPPRLYPEGKSPLQRRSMHHNCTLSSFGFMKECIRDDVYADIRDNSQVGVILKLADSDYVWWAKLVHYMLTRQLAIERSYEMWALIEGSPIRFSLYEYEDISGLNCDMIDEEDKVDVDHTEFWAELNVDVGVGPNWFDLDEALKQCRTSLPELRKKIGLLFVLHVGILGLSRSSRIPLEYAKRVLDSEAFERFPWGRVGFKELIQSIKVVSFENDTYAIHGCVYVLMVWALESLVNFGKKYGTKRKIDDDDVEEVVPLLCWGGGRPRITLESTLAAEKKLKKKVDVKHLVFRREEDIYPMWPGENAVFGEGVCGNKLLDNLLHDLFLGCVDEKEWSCDAEEVVYDKKAEKRQAAASSGDDFVDPPPMKKYKARTSSYGDVKGGEKGALEGVLQLLGKLDCKMDEMNENFGGKLKSIGEQVQEIEKKVSVLENDVVELKRGKEFSPEKAELEETPVEEEDQVADDEGSKTGEAGGEVEKDEMKQTSQDDFPISCVSKNPAKKSRLSLKNIKNMRRAALDEKKLKTPITKQPVVAGLEETRKELKSRLSLKNIKNMRRAALDEKKLKTPITKQPVVACLEETRKELTTPKNQGGRLLRKQNQPLSSDSGFSDPIENAARKNIELAIDKLYLLCKDDDIGSPNKRDRNLAATQLDPYIGSSVVKRILKGKVLSSAHYDPFEKVSAGKVDKLMAFIDDELANGLDSCDSSANFYLRIMTPKELWPKKDPRYGWLKDAHLCPMMHMLRKRSMQTVSPFLSDRIAFLDPWFVNQWAHDYKKFDCDKNWLFPESYFKVYNGLYPNYGMTKKRWVDDVDVLYFAHNINNDHWVAVVVDLVGRRVNVYDSICSLYSDDEVMKSCKPYIRMTPALMHSVAPPEKKKKISARAFTFYRSKTCPQNLQQGDCGIFAVKYIECLAIGISYEGLSDAAMPAIRLKLAAEIFDEVPDTDCFIQMSDPNPRGSEAGGVEFISQREACV